jgi:hypothetical protein
MIGDRGQQQPLAASEPLPPIERPSTVFRGT